MIAQRVIAASTFIAVLLLAQVPVAGQPSQTFQPEFRHVLTYGDDPDAPLQQLLVDVEVLTTDDRDRVFIGDTGDLSIKVIDLQAGFVHRMGGKGSAPGEFRDISALAVDDSGHLLVFDGTNDRVSRFSADGGLVETIRLDLGLSVELRNLRQLANGQYLSLFTPLLEESSTPIFHVISQDLTTELDSFGQIQNHGNAEDDFFLRTFSGKPGRFWLESEQQLIYAPSLYDGALFRYRETTDGWALAERPLRGMAIPDGPFRRVEPEYFKTEHFSDGEMGSTIYFRRERHSAVILSKSQGVYVLTDGRIAHFSLQYTGDGYEHFLEIFSEDGQLMHFGPIPGIDGADDVVLDEFVHLMWKDESDRFYLLDEANAPLLHVVELSY